MVICANAFVPFCAALQVGLLVAATQEMSDEVCAIQTHAKERNDAFTSKRGDRPCVPTWGKWTVTRMFSKFTRGGMHVDTFCGKSTDTFTVQCSRNELCTKTQNTTGNILVNQDGHMRGGPWFCCNQGEAEVVLSQTTFEADDSCNLEQNSDEANYSIVDNKFHDEAEDWDAKLPGLVQQFEENATLTGLVSAALAYARQQVEQHLPAIKDNVKATGLKAVDLLWPGNGYNEAAYGGQFEVFSLLQNEGVLKLGSIMGASGGACSTILSLADNQSSGATVLEYNMIYSQQDITAASQWWRETPFWSAVYRFVLQDANAFTRVKQQGRVVCSCGFGRPTFGSNSAFYNFTSTEQATQAYYASGDASLGGVTVGTNFLSLAGACCDGGGVGLFPNSSSAVLYYNAFYGDALSASIEDIVALFHHGVDETISLLESPALKVDKDNGNGGMMAVLPGSTGKVTDADFAPVEAAFGFSQKKTTFYDIGDGTSVIVD